jgi:hypothetical protein
MVIWLKIAAMQKIAAVPQFLGYDVVELIQTKGKSS